MRSSLLRALPIAALLAGAGAGLAPCVALAASADAALEQIGGRFLNGWLARHPQNATRLGVHEYDRQLIPVTQSSLADETAWLHKLRGQLDSIPRSAFSFNRMLDRDVLSARIDRELLDLEVIRPYEHNPNAYLDLVAGSIQSLLQRRFASPTERATSVLHRLRQCPRCCGRHR